MGRAVPLRRVGVRLSDVHRRGCVGRVMTLRGRGWLPLTLLAVLVLWAAWAVFVIASPASAAGTSSIGISSDSEDVAVMRPTPDYAISPLVVGDVDSTHYDGEVFFRFDGLLVDAGDTLDYAALTLPLETGFAGSRSFEVFAVDADDCLAPADATEFDALALSHESVVVVATDPAPSDGANAAVAPLVAEVAARPGWVGGNAICFVARPVSFGYDGDAQGVEFINGGAFLEVGATAPTTTTTVPSSPAGVVSFDESEFSALWVGAALVLLATGFAFGLRFYKGGA